MLRTATQLRREESGQVLVLFAVAMLAMMGLLVIGVDLALVGGQRRFDQNGADAASLAVAQQLAGEVSLRSGGVYFGMTDELVYQTARQYSGLRPDSANWSSAIPTGTNQSVGLTTRNHLAVTLEYWGTQEWGATWCYSPTGPRPARTPAMATCTLYDATPSNTTDLLYPPLPAANIPFKVRVTVSSTVDGFFTQALGARNGAPDAPALNDNASAACIRPHSGAKTAGTQIWTWTPLGLASAPGRTTCAQAVASISGSLSYIPPPVLPFTTADCNVSGVPGALSPLWSSTALACDGSSMGGFKNYLDLSDESTWCDNSNYDYRYTDNLPPEAGTCVGTDASWQRNGYSHDPAHLGGNSAPQDIAYWLGKGGFGGQVRADTLQANSTYLADGNWFPTYINACTVGTSCPAEGDQTGNHGQNIAVGLYCAANKITVGGDGCTDSRATSGTYFFARSKLMGTNGKCFDEWGKPPYNLGCREAGIITWVDPQLASGVTAPGFNNPERIRARRVLKYRIYCAYNGSGFCGDPPPGSSSSDAQGRFVSTFLSGPPDCPSCAVSITGNHVAFE